MNRVLAPPTTEAVRVAATEIKAPFLKPVDFDPADGFSPDEAALLAVLANPDLRALRDSRGIAKAQVLQAGLLPNPQLTYGVDVPFAGDPTSQFTAYGVGLDWDVTSLITHGAEEKAAGLEKAAVDLDVAWQEWRVAEAAKTSAYRLFSLEAEAALARDILQRLEENAALVRRAYSEGQATGLEMEAAQSAALQARSSLLDLEKSVQEERILLKSLMGLPPQAEAALQKGIELPSKLTPPGYETLAKGIEARRLDLLALRRGYESQEEKVRRSILAQFPKINFGVTQSRDTSDVFSAGFGVGVELPIFDRNQGRIALERATRQQLFDEYASRVHQARADIAKLVADILSVNLQIEAAEAEESSLERLVADYRQAVGQGQADVLSYYDSWNNLTQKKIEIVMLKEQLMENAVALELASGLYSLDADGAGGAGAKQPGKKETP